MGRRIVTGRAIFGADVKLPGMLTAVIARPPAVGGKVARYDPTRALAVNGVSKRHRDPRSPKRRTNFSLAVVWQSLPITPGLRCAVAPLLDVTWEPGTNAGYDSKKYREKLEGRLGARHRRSQGGRCRVAMRSAAKRVEAEYHVPHLPHMPMEPVVCGGKVDGNRVKCGPHAESAGRTTGVREALGSTRRR